MNSTLNEFKNLIDIICELREKCPWDRKQTLETLRSLTISEVYELSDAITNNSVTDIKDELGDLLGHILFYSTIGEEKKLFDLLDVIVGIKNKLIRRHPHIYGDIREISEEEVRKNWELTKLNKEGKKSIFGGLPKSLPPLLKAKILNEKYNNLYISEIKQATIENIINDIQNLANNADILYGNDKKRLENYLGDVIFALSKLASINKIDIDKSLEIANIKFIKGVESQNKDSK